MSHAPIAFGKDADLLYILRTYAKVFQQGKAPKTVHLSTAKCFNTAGAVLRKSY